MKLHKKHIFKIGLSALLLIAVQGCEPNANYPVTHRVGWVTSENINWKVLELSAEFKHQKFNLTNFEGQIIIKAKVKVSAHEKSVHKIEKLHINQRYIQEDSAERVASIALIEITPIIIRNSDNETKVESAIFDLVINEPIQNRDWGPNYYRVKIWDQQIDLETHQFK
jgi:hypothetical protein